MPSQLVLWWKVATPGIYQISQIDGMAASSRLRFSDGIWYSPTHTDCIVRLSLARSVLSQASASFVMGPKAQTVVRRLSSCECTPRPTSYERLKVVVNQEFLVLPNNEHGNGSICVGWQI